MRVLGIDPGTHRLGWAIIEGTASRPSSFKHGCLEIPANTPASTYLIQIHDFLCGLISHHDLDLMGIESIRFQKNVKTAISVAEARGVVLLVASQHALPVLELAPNTVKSTVAGHGGGGKQEVKRMVGLLLGTDTSRLLDDECDALAIALTAITITKHNFVSNINH